MKSGNGKPTLLALSLLALAALACVDGKSSQTYKVVYRIDGSAKFVSVTYRNQDGGTEQSQVNVPWTKEMQAQGGDFLYISAQNKGGSGDVVTSISVNGQVLKSATSTGAYVISTSSMRCCERSLN